MATKEEKKEIKAEVKAQEDWMTKKWRPMMAIMYMACCLFDFAIFPIMFTIVQFWEVQAANDAFRQWVPITLQGGGLFHVAMGAVLGVSAYGRTQEKVAGASTVNTGIGPQSSFGSPQQSSFGSPQQSSFGVPHQSSFGGNSFGGNQNYSSPQPMNMGMSGGMSSSRRSYNNIDPDAVLERG
jgi:hypothetical protein